MIAPSDFSAFLVTIKLATMTTLVLLIVGTPLAWWLSRSQWKYRFLVEAIIALPLVLPPTVLGFYLLVMLGPNGPLGQLMQMFNLQPLVFTFGGLLLGSVVYSMPFVVQPLQNAFSAMGRRPMEVAATLRASPLDRFFTVAVPLAAPGFLTASVLGFAHTLGEFGVVLMIGGNIPGKTQVLSIAIYDHVESLEYTQAHILSGALLVLSFLMLIAVYSLNRRFSMVKP